MTQKKLIDINLENTLKINTITQKSSNYPYLLKNTKNPPEYLYTTGEIEIINLPSVAVVGTRKPTKEGKNATKKIVDFYAGNGFVIVSGLAKGIDSIAMETAIDLNAPVIGVLPSSLDNIVPKKNESLAKDVLNNNGLLISEHNESTKVVRKYQYINRNRIISGISLATIVVEMAAKGGTMHTVKFAKEQLRPILVADLPAEGNQQLKEESYPIISV